MANYTKVAMSDERLCLLRVRSRRGTLEARRHMPKARHAHGDDEERLLLNEL
jgi:hypothetical protein